MCDTVAMHQLLHFFTFIFTAITLLLVLREVISDEKCLTRNEICNSENLPCRFELGEGTCSASDRDKGCKFDDIDNICQNNLSSRCQTVYESQRFSVSCPDDDETNEQPPPPSSGDNKTTVIVIAVCVSVVVLIIAALIAGVYCWRVRRNQERQKSAIDIEKREKSVTNDDFRSEIGSPRRDSTYNTITDLGREPSYHSLNKQNPPGADGYNKLRDVTDSKVATPYQVGKPRTNPNENGDEYNRIDLKKSSACNFDPSYDHLRSRDSDSDYNSTSDVTSKSSGAYNYGVPIRMKVLEGYDLHVTSMGSTNKESVNVKNGETERTTHAEGVDDDYVIPKDDLPNLRNSIVDKPRAVVSPMITTAEPDKSVSTNIPHEFGNGGQALNVTHSNREESFEIERKATFNDDYELATSIETRNIDDKMEQNDTVPNAEGTIEDNKYSMAVKSENRGSYEVALVGKPSKSVDNYVAGLEPKSGCESQTDESQMKPVSGSDYEVAVVKSTRLEDSGEQMDVYKERVDLDKENSVDVKSENKNDYEEAVIDNNPVIGNVPQIGLPTRVTVGDTQRKSMGDDGYELAAVNNVERS